MKRIIYIIAIIAGFVFNVKGQNMDAVFTAMPDQYIPQLEDAWRKDLIDLYNNSKDATLKNTMNGNSTLKKLTPDYLLLEVTDRSTVEMKLLPLINNTKLICMVTTVNGPVPDSRIQFFTTDWQPLNSKDLFTPVGSEWFFKEGINKNSISFMEAASLLDMDLWEYSLNPDNTNLVMTYTTPQYLSKEDREKIKSYLKDSPKVYTWEKSHFK